MSTIVEKQQVTPADLLAMPDSVAFELVNGELVERKMGAESSMIAMRFGSRMQFHVEQNSLGYLFMADCGYQCFSDDADKVRKPDVSFVRVGRFEGEQIPKGYVRIPPDLAVEVLSPRDLDYETDEKVEEYLAARVRLVWVVNPESRTVLIYRANGSIVGLREQDELNGEDVLPGFRCRVAELFATPAPIAGKKQ